MVLLRPVSHDRLRKDKIEIIDTGNMDAIETTATRKLASHSHDN